MIVVTLVIVAARGYDTFSEYPLVPDNYIREQTQTIKADDVSYLSFSYLAPMIPPQKVSDRKAIVVFINALHHAYTQVVLPTDRVYRLEIHFKKADGNESPTQTFEYAPSEPGDCFGNDFYQALQEYHIKSY